MDPILTTLLVIAATCLIALAYLFGRLHEREAWNKLIDKGAIPAPPYRSSVSKQLDDMMDDDHICTCHDKDSISLNEYFSKRHQ